VELEEIPPYQKIIFRLGQVVALVAMAIIIMLVAEEELVLFFIMVQIQDLEVTALDLAAEAPVPCLVQEEQEELLVPMAVMHQDMEPVEEVAALHITVELEVVVV
jgi:hypothetical protein